MLYEHFNTNSFLGIFENNPELSKIGTLEQYTEYINLIFPDSKVKDILYHGGKSEFDVFKNRQVDKEVGVMNGIYLTPDIKYAKEYGKNIKSVIINTLNPLITEGSWTGIINDETKQKILDKGYDAVINNAFDNSKLDKFFDKLKLNRMRKETIVFESEQIHILGSKKDIEGFKKYINN